LALHDGKDRLTKQLIGPKTGDPSLFLSFDDLLEAYQRQMEFFVRHNVIENNIIDVIQQEIMPEPFVSCFVPDCIDKGKDVTAGGAIVNWTGPLGVGVANVGNSLAAVKKVVFDDKAITMQELIKALDNDFGGQEPLRLQLLAAPKYGNDLEEVDWITRKAIDIFFDAVESYSNPRGGPFIPSLIPVASNIPLGWVTGATPEGRRAKTPLADGISPTHGTDKKGPTAVLRSVSKLDHVRATNGTILNQKFSSLTLAGEEGLAKFASFLRGFVDLGIQHIQCNVVSADILRDAQKTPEKYPALVVRVAGYSAFFNEICKDVQDDIIERTEQSL
jgi:formate C-acetyltransferase